MLSLGRFRSHSCAGWSRREFLRAAAAAPFLANLTPQRAARARSAAKAKSVIFVWLWGAPSHLDTFDPKPRAPREFRGPFTPIATRTSGLHFTELLPRLAARSDKFSLVRSNVNQRDGHPEAGTFGVTGFGEGPAPIQPSFGSIAARRLGGGGLPPYIMLGRGVPRDIARPIKAGGGEWGPAYDPFLVECDDAGEVNMPSVKMLEGLTPQRLADRRALASQIERLKRRHDGDALDRWDQAGQRAHALLTSKDAVRALDLSRESEPTRESYGATAFGQSLLLARRLVENGAPYVHVNWSEYVEALTPNTDFGWDTHVHNFDLLPSRHCPIFDRALAALLDDLRDRGLLDSTLVVCLGEFGRTPKINKRAARDHWPQCYFSLWAGGGVKPGRVVGASDAKGEHPITRPIDTAAVGVTLLDLLGVDSVARAELNVLRGAEVIHELL